MEKESKNLKKDSEVEKMMNETHNPHNNGSTLRFVLEIIKITLVALAIIVPVRYFLIKPFYVNGASMEPTYHNKEYLIINEISYRFDDPKRGEVVVFHYPRDEKQFFIKRVIGLPGERVVVRDNNVTVFTNLFPEGITIKEPYLLPHTNTPGEVDITLGNNEYFVLGDNRTASLDSRRFGAVNKSEIVGKTWFRGWPFDKAGVLEHYDFQF